MVSVYKLTAPNPNENDRATPSTMDFTPVLPDRPTTSIRPLHINSNIYHLRDHDRPPPSSLFPMPNTAERGHRQAAARNPYVR